MHYIKTLFLSVLLVGLSSGIAFAQQVPSLPDLSGLNPEDFEQVAGIVIANVNVYDVRITGQNDRDVSVAFEIVNDDTVVQPQVRYSVQLLEYTDMGEDGIHYRFADEHVYEEMLSIDPGEHVVREVTYTVPLGFSGSYAIGVYSANNSGMPFSINHAQGYIDVPESDDALIVDHSSCSLLVEGEEEGYSLAFGVDVDQTEILRLKCSMTNASDTDRIVTAQFTLREDSNFGPVVSEWKGEKVAFTGGEEGTHSFVVSLPDRAGAYEAELSFIDEAGNTISKSIYAHFVVRGESARIDNLKLDKNYYSAGEIAEVTVTFSGRADYFFGSRAHGEGVPELGIQAVPFSVSIKSGLGQECAQPTSGEYSTDNQSGMVILNIPITKDCNDPHAEVVAMDSSGNVLDASVFSAESDDDTGFSLTPTQALILIGIIIVLGVAGIILFRRGHMDDNTYGPRSKDGGSGITKGGTMLSMFIGLFVVMAFLGGSVQEAQATTITVPPPAPWSALPYAIQLTANPSKSTYTTSDPSNIPISGSMKQQSCGNAWTKGYGYVDGDQVAYIYCHYVSGYCGKDSFSKKVSRGGVGKHSAKISALYVLSDPKWNQSGSGKVYWNVVQDGPEVDLSASPNPVDYNTSSILSWNVKNATSCTASGDWNGPKSASGGNESTGSLTSQKTYTLQCSDDQGETDSDSVTVQVNEPTQCSDGIDNDGDGWTDTDDQGCDGGGGIGNPAETNESAETGESGDPAQCSDGIDNDSDGLIDANDPNCTNGFDDNEAPDPDFSLQSSNGLEVSLVEEGGAQDSNTTTITVNDAYGFDHDVDISAISVSPSLPGIQYHFSDTTLGSNEYDTGTELYVTVPGNTEKGSYTIVVQGANGGLVRTANVPLVVQAFAPDIIEF